MSLTNYLHILLICLLPFIGFSQNENVFESEKANWIQNIPVNGKSSEIEKEARGYLFLLLDNQVNIQQQESYNRMSFKILNAQGIQDMSDFSIDFDPVYQKVKIHSINLIRNGKTIDKLDLNNLQVIQRETNMERSLYDGRLSALFNISDVRVNDIIDYSYTVAGFNPIHKGNFQNSYYLNFTDPIRTIHLSVLVPTDEKLYYKVFNSQDKPIITNNGNLKKYSFTIKDPEIVKYQDNTPVWYVNNAYVEFSQYKNWKEVANNFDDYYGVTEATRSWLEEKSKQIFTGETDSLTEIIRFVQDDIRYLGFENGLNSHKPSDPKDVFERRFGDCKDKSLLLSELLKINGIDANPILVSSYNSETLKDKLPSPDAFDHCIVQLNLDDEIRYIDPTINFQGGNLNSTYFPDYAFGLPLQHSSKDLMQFPDPESRPTRIFETIHINEIGGNAELNVTTSYYGKQADYIRRDFSENKLADIQENYTKFYSSLYPVIAASEEIMFDDYRNIENKIIVTEKYTIEDLWKEDEATNNLMMAKFYPLSLDSYVFPNENLNRKDPYYIDPDLNVEHHISVLLPESWGITAERQEIKNPNFEYSFDLKPNGNRFEMVHTYRNLTDNVKADDYANYINDIKEVQNHLNYFITYDSTFVPGGETSAISWISIFTFFIAFSASIYFAYKIYTEYDLPSRAPTNYTEDSIGGWLILLGIGLCFGPVIILSQMFTNPDFFNPQLWNLLTGEYFGLAVLMLFELMFNAASLVFSVFILLLFFKKRTIAPRIIIIYLIVNFLFMIFDTGLVVSLNSELFTEMEKSEFYADIIGAMIRMLIWVPYLYYSVRVKETFVIRKNPEKNRIEPDKIEPVISLD